MDPIFHTRDILIHVTALTRDDMVIESALWLHSIYCGQIFVLYKLVMAIDILRNDTIASIVCIYLFCVDTWDLTKELERNLDMIMLT